MSPYIHKGVILSQITLMAACETSHGKQRCNRYLYSHLQSLTRQSTESNSQPIWGVIVPKSTTAKDQGKAFLFSVGTKMEAGGIQFMEEMCQQEWCEDSGLPESHEQVEAWTVELPSPQELLIPSS